MPVSRETLYAEVWAEPMLKVAVRYGVSSSFLARVCQRLNVPRPSRGYWARLGVGQVVPRPELPDARPGDELEWLRDGSPRGAPTGLPKTPTAARSRRRPRSDRPDRHDLVAEARQHFDGAKLSDRGYLRPTKRRLIDLFVTGSTLDRALDLANDLFLTLEDRRHRVMFPLQHDQYRRNPIDERIEGGLQDYHSGRWNPDRPTLVFIGTVAISLTIFEFSEKVEVRYIDGQYVRVDQRPVSKRPVRTPNFEWTHMRDTPTGRLCIRASSPYSGTTWEKQWRESESLDLAKVIQKVVRTLEAEAGTIAVLVEEKRRQAEIEYQRWQVQQETWTREEAERRRTQNIKESEDELFAIVQAWGIAKRTEGFFEDAERRALDLCGDDRAAIIERLNRARALLGGIDALQCFREWRAPEER